MYKMKKYFFIASVLFLIGFVFACDTGCENSQDLSKCYNYGDVEKIGNLFFFCDSETDALSKPRENGAECVNNFECSVGYCVSEVCNGYYADIIQVNAVLSESAPGLCPEFEDTTGTYFCSDSLFVANAAQLTAKTCDSTSYCFKCNSSAYTYNSTLNICTKGLCDVTPGQFCLNASVSNSSEKEGYYCSNNKKCFSCDSNFDWNSTLSQCILRPCTNSPGCMNITNLTNGQIIENRRCDVGSCFVCKSGYSWNANTSMCVLSSNSTSIPMVKVAVSSSDLAAGTYNSLSINDRVSLSFAGRTYYFDLLGIDYSKITFEIYPTFSNQILSSGSSRGFDFDNDGTYDLKIIYAGVVSGNANVSLKYVSEPYATQTPEVITTTNNTPVVPIAPSPSTATDSSFTKNIWIFIVIGIFVILLFILLFVYLLRKNTASKPDLAGSSSNNPAPQQPMPPVMPGNAPRGYPIGGYRPLPPRPSMPQNPIFR